MIARNGRHPSTFINTFIFRTIKMTDSTGQRRIADRATMIDEKMDNLRDRLARTEQDIKNNKENFNNFKLEDFNSLKSEVQVMRKEINAKIDTLIEKVSSINITMAKWVGGFSVLMFIGELVAKKFIT